MKGYFSKIARQSGVRIANQPAPQTRPVSDSAPLPPRIDREEVVMIAPDVTPLSTTPPSHVETKSVPESQGAPAKETRARVDEVPQSKLPTGREKEERAPGKAETTTKEPKIETIDVPSPRRARDDQEHTAPLEAPDATVLVPPVPEPPALPAQTDTSVDHFADTIKIISGREVSKEEASATLVREIHEWIAAAPTEPEMHVDAVVPSVREVARPDRVEVTEREPGVVRISGELVTKRENAPKKEGYPRPVESASIHEQTLDLSIGSINVIIEGDPTPAQQVQPAVRTAEASSDAPRTSRLRRNYI